MNVALYFGVFLTLLSIYPLTANEIEDVVTKQGVKEAPVLRTQQGKLIGDIFRQVKQLHLIALDVTNEETFKVYEKRLEELEASLRETLSKLSNLEPLDAADQEKLRDALQEEETEIMALAEEASQHMAGLRNIHVGKRIRERQATLVDQISPAIAKQSTRHYKPASGNP